MQDQRPQKIGTRTKRDVWSRRRIEQDMIRLGDKNRLLRQLIEKLRRGNGWKA